MLVAVVAREGRAARAQSLPPDRRAAQGAPLYVALANTLIGVVMIVFALLGVLAELAGVPATVATILALSVIGVATTRRAPKLSR